MWPHQWNWYYITRFSWSVDKYEEWKTLRKSLYHFSCLQSILHASPRPLDRPERQADWSFIFIWFLFHIVVVFKSGTSWSHFFTGSLPCSFLAKRTQFTFLFCLHTSALVIFWSCMHRSRTREVGSEERWLWKSFYCLSSSPSWLPSVQLLSCPNFSQADSRPPDCCCSTTARWARRWSSSRPRRIRVKSIAENVIFSLNKMYKLLQQMQPHLEIIDLLKRSVRISGPLCWFKVHPKSITHKTNRFVFVLFDWKKGLNS